MGKSSGVGMGALADAGLLLVPTWSDAGLKLAEACTHQNTVFGLTVYQDIHGSVVTSDRTLTVRGMVGSTESASLSIGYSMPLNRLSATVCQVLPIG